MAAANWLVQHGPFAIGMAIPDNFFYYTNNIYDPKSSECNDAANRGGRWHAMTVVGYGKQTLPSGESAHYWLVKNSWGTGHGIEGFAKIRMGKNACFLADHMVGAMIE